MHVDVSGLQTDLLTGLPNRAMFDAQLDLAISVAHDLGRRTGVMIVDMNKLKLINDVHGHRIGDEALRALAAELKKMAGPGYWWSRGSGATSSELSSPPITMLCPHGELTPASRRASPVRSGRDESHIRLCKRWDSVLSRGRRDRQRTAHFRRQVHVCTQAWIIGGLGIFLNERAPTGRRGD